MTNLQADTSPTTTAPPWVARAGLICLVAGLLGAASGLFLAVYPAQVSDDMYDYPLTADGFTGIQFWFVVQHLGLIAGLASLAAAGVMAPGGFARWGAWLSLAGMALLTVTELLAIGARDSTYPGDMTGTLDTLYGVSSIAAGIGLILAGIAVRRGGRWAGWRRNIVLVAGIFVFIPMTPAIMGPFVLARLAITCWMLLFAALGYALWRSGPARPS